MTEHDKIKEILLKHSSFDFNPLLGEIYTGTLVVLEGNDGAGKTTLSKKLVDMINILSDIKQTAHYVRTPGGTELGEVLRSILLDSEYSICSMAEALLFQAQLAQCINQVILPCLVKGDIVICDRLIFSALAYQSCGREQDMQDIWDRQLHSLQEVWPDFGFMLRNPAKKESSGDRIEEAGKQFSERVKAYYDLILQTNTSAAELMMEVSVFPTPNETARFLYNQIIHRIKHHI